MNFKELIINGEFEKALELSNSISPKNKSDFSFLLTIDDCLDQPYLYTLYEHYLKEENSDDHGYSSFILEFSSTQGAYEAKVYHTRRAVEICTDPDDLLICKISELGLFDYPFPDITVKEVIKLIREITQKVTETKDETILHMFNTNIPNCLEELKRLGYDNVLSEDFDINTVKEKEKNYFEQTKGMTFTQLLEGPWTEQINQVLKDRSDEDKKRMILDAAYEMQEIQPYFGVLHLMSKTGEDAVLHHTAAMILINTLTHVPGTLYAAAYNLKRCIEIDPENDKYKEDLFKLSIVNPGIKTDIVINIPEPEERFEINGDILHKYTGTGKSIIIPQTITRIDKRAFSDELDNVLFTQTEEVTLPVNLQSIEEAAFYNNYNLKIINTNANLKYIGDNAFYSCKKLTKIQLPESLEIIGQRAFKSCMNLQDIELPKQLKKLGEEAFYQTGLTKVTIPENIKTIPRKAFSLCKKLKQVTIEEGIETIGPKAFYECENLEKINIPDSVKAIGALAFYGCKSLQTIKLGENVESLGIPHEEHESGGTFWWCENLKSIYIPASTTYIGSEMFIAVKSLTIYGKEGSYAQQYANEKGIPFVAV